MTKLCNPQSSRTCAITVTYGNRFTFLRQAVAGALANGVQKLIIVDNGCEPTCRRAIHELEQNCRRRLTVLTLGENQGSARGYNTGLKCAMSHSACDFIWLLDDDNFPSKGALAELLFYHSKLSAVVPMGSLALASLRGDWEHHRELAQGSPPCKAFPRRSSFQWFHFLDLPKRFRKFLHSKRAANTKVLLTSPVEIPFAPYGGLFFHKSAVSKIGYPDERFFVYGDDTEYTYRFVERGGKLFLIPSSVLFDAERMWFSSKQKTLFSSLLVADSDFRVYYATRNQCYFDRHCWAQSHLTYTFNKWAFFVMLGIFAVRYQRWKRYAMIAHAVRDGELGQLGRVKELEKP